MCLYFCITVAFYSDF